jgi:DNA-binding beta-propeller fold protein YncE
MMPGQEFLMLKKPSVLYVVIATVALSVGMVVYLLDRQPEHVYFLSHGLTAAHAPHALFGVAGNYLPAFLHVYAFMLLTVAAAGSANAQLIRIGAAWFVVASLFEFGQHPAVSPLIAASLPAWFAHIPVLDNTAAYFLKGTFDPLDLLSSALGTLAACFTVVMARNLVRISSLDMSMRSSFRSFALGGVAVFGMLAAIGSGGGATGDDSTAAGEGSQLYVSGNSSGTLLVFNDANTVSGSTSANRIVAGGLTTLNAPRGIAVDMARNQIYVANYANNTILVFHSARSVTGGDAPSRTISAGTLSGPTALFVDIVNDRLYVANTVGNSVLVYDNASTLNGAVTPDRALAGATTDLNAPTGIYVDSTRNLLYVSNASNQILTFSNAAAVTGNVAPVRTIDGLNNPGGIFVDVMADRLYVANTGGNSVFVFDDASTATSISPPDRVLSGGSSALNQPRDVFVDTGTDRLYVTNAGDDSVLVFNNASTADDPDMPGRALNLTAATGPWGIYVDVTPLVIASTASLDGFARDDLTASTSGSPATGDKEASYSLGVGWRQLYSFDIASIPVGTTIISATLRLYQCDVQGLPYMFLGNVIVDQMNYGDVFDPFGSAYSGAAAALNIGTLSTTTGLSYRSLSVTTQVQSDLTASRERSQYRLRFSTQDYNLDGNDDFVQFTDAEDSLCAGTTTNQPPQLAVTLKP